MLTTKAVLWQRTDGNDCMWTRGGAATKNNLMKTKRLCIGIEKLHGVRMVKTIKDKSSFIWQK